MSKKYYLVTDIEWDITEADMEEYEVTEEDLDELPVDLITDIDAEDIEDYDKDEIEEYIMDQLSEEYGWCISGCDIKKITKREYMKLSKESI